MNRNLFYRVTPLQVEVVGESRHEWLKHSGGLSIGLIARACPQIYATVFIVVPGNTSCRVRHPNAGNVATSWSRRVSIHHLYSVAHIDQPGYDIYAQLVCTLWYSSLGDTVKVFTILGIYTHPTLWVGILRYIMMVIWGYWPDIISMIILINWRCCGKYEMKGTVIKYCQMSPIKIRYCP